MGVLTQYETDIGGLDSALVNKIGTTTLTTTAQNLSGAVNELDAELGNETLPDSSKTVKGNINSLKQSLSNLILDDITLSNQTTNSQGMIVTNLNFDGRWVSAYVGGGRYASFRPSGSDKLVIRLVNDNGEAVTNTTVNVTLYHLGPIS